MNSRKVTTRNANALSQAVALPASTGDGIAREIAAVDILKPSVEQNGDKAGDLAADLATRPVLAVGTIVEPVSPGIGVASDINDNAAGDAAAIEAGASASAPMIAQAHTTNALVSDIAVEKSNIEHEDLVEPEFIVFDLTKPVTEEDRANLKLIEQHINGSQVQLSNTPAIPEGRALWSVTAGFADRFPLTMLSFQNARKELDLGSAPVLRIRSKIDGFRRAGLSHPAQAVDHPLETLRPEQVEAYLAEPNLIVELV